MYAHRIAMSAVAAATILFLAAACSDVSEPTLLAPASPDAATYGHTLIECPVNEEESVTGTYGATGGSLTLRKHEVRLPRLAVLAPTGFALKAPVSNYMEISVRANGRSDFAFNVPVTIVIDYSRCTRSNIDKESLTVWKIDPETKTLLQNMGGVDDKEARTLTFQTETLSTWSIAR